MTALPTKPWYRPRNLILLAFALFLTALGRQLILALTAKPGEAIDYAAKLEELIESNQPADAGPSDAWPVLLDTIQRKTEVEESLWPSAQRQYGTPIDYSALSAPHSSETYDGSHSWAEVDARAREGLAALRDAGVFARMEELTRIRRAVRPIPKGHLLEILLPELGHTRALARANGARMYQSHLSGDDREFVSAFEQTLALARIIGGQALLIDHLVGIAIQALAENHVREALTERPFGPDTCQALLDAIDRQQPMAPLWVSLEGERISTLDVIQWTHTDDGHGSGRLMLSAWRQLGATTGGFSGPSGGWLDALLGSKLINLGAVAFPSKAATTKKANEFYDICVSYSKLSPAERSSAQMSPSRYMQERLPARYTILNLLIPAIDKSIASQTQSDMTLAATRIMLAIEIYRGRNGRYPAALADLVPAILKELPKDPYNAAGAWGYRLIDPSEDTVRRADGSPRPYLLYSFGADGKDNGGKALDKNPYSALNQHNSGGADFILNQPRNKPFKPEAPAAPEAPAPPSPAG